MWHNPWKGSTSRSLWKRGQHVSHQERQWNKSKAKKLMQVRWWWQCGLDLLNTDGVSLIDICRSILDHHPWKRVIQWANGLSLKNSIYLHCMICTKNCETKILIWDWKNIRNSTSEKIYWLCVNCLFFVHCIVYIYMHDFVDDMHLFLATWVAKWLQMWTQKNNQKTESIPSL